MPDEYGNIKGKGWSRASEAAYERIFGNAATQQPAPRPRVPDLMAALEASLSSIPPLCCNGLGPCTTCPRRPVPREPSREVPDDTDSWSPEDYDQERSAR